MSWIAVGVGGARALIGGVQANQERQRQKGIIGNAYKIGRQRLDLSQMDTRERIASESGQRGLVGGGDVTAGSEAKTAGEGGVTTVGGAHTLGAQQGVDLAREQQVEQTALGQQRDVAYSDVNSAATNAIIGSVESGISDAFAAKGALNTRAALAGGSKIAASYGSPTMVDSPPPGSTPSAYPNSFRGIDPIDPMGRGAWAVDTFNKFDRGEG